MKRALATVLFPALACSSLAWAQTVPAELAPYMAAADVPKKAYVVGIPTYKHQPPIPSATKDVADIASQLATLGFEVKIAKPDVVADADSLLADFQAFLESTAPRSIVLFYFSGHGFWYGGENYLVPADADLASPPKDLITGTVSHPAKINVAVSTIRGNIANTLPGHSLIIIDACRSQPVFGFPPEDPSQKSSKFRDVSGTYIFFATGEGKYAQGSTDPQANSRYTKHLLKHINSDGSQILDVHRDTTEDVIFDSGNTQQPWFAGLYLSQIYLKPTDEQLKAEKEIWAAALTVGSEEKIRRFVAKLPGSRYAQAAYQWLRDRETAPRATPASRINPLAVEAPESFGSALTTGRLEALTAWGGTPKLPGLEGSIAINMTQSGPAVPLTHVFAKGPSIVVRASTQSYGGFAADLPDTRSRILNQGDQLTVRNAFSFRDKNWLEAVTRDGQVVYLSDFEVPNLASLQGKSRAITIPFKGDDVLAPFNIDGLRAGIASLGPQTITGVAIRLKPSTAAMTDYIRTTAELRLVRLIAAVQEAGVDQKLIGGLISSERSDQEPNTALVTIRYSG